MDSHPVWFVIILILFQIIPSVEQHNLAYCKIKIISTKKWVFPEDSNWCLYMILNQVHKFTFANMYLFDPYI